MTSQPLHSCHHSLLPSGTSMWPRYLTLKVLEKLGGGRLLLTVDTLPAVSRSGCRGEGRSLGWGAEVKGSPRPPGTGMPFLREFGDFFTASPPVKLRWKLGDFFCEALSDWLDWLDGSRKLREGGREGKAEGWVVAGGGAGVGATLGILGMPALLSFFRSISLLTQERIFSLSNLHGSCDSHVTLRWRSCDILYHGFILLGIGMGLQRESIIITHTLSLSHTPHTHTTHTHSLWRGLCRSLCCLW